jgi:hypothetical protein
MTIAEVGDNIVTTSTLYGGTYNLFAHTLPRFGIEARFADYRDIDAMGRLDRRQDQGGILRIHRQPGGERGGFRCLGRKSPTPTACR